MATARQKRAKRTQRERAAARPKLHPRGLARSVAKSLGLGKDWRKVSKLPRTGRKYLHPERRRKVAAASAPKD